MPVSRDESPVPLTLAPLRSRLCAVEELRLPRALLGWCEVRRLAGEPAGLSSGTTLEKLWAPTCARELRRGESMGNGAPVDSSVLSLVSGSMPAPGLGTGSEERSACWPWLRVCCGAIE